MIKNLNFEFCVDHLKSTILLVLPFEEISIWSELSSAPHFRIHDRYPKRDKRRTDGNPCVLYQLEHILLINQAN